MRRRTFYFITIILLFFGANFFVLNIESQTKPFTIEQILRAMASVNQKKVTSAKIINDVRQRKVDFPLTAENETLLRNGGATDELIETLRQNSLSVSNPTKTSMKILLGSNNLKTFKNSIGMEFIYVPSGSFMMGSEDDGNKFRKAHRVTISKGFYMGKYEVTQEEYEKVMGTNPSHFKNCPRCPVENVSWDDAQDFIKTLNAKNEETYRLPTEAEWEYAARGGTKTKWSFGNRESQLGIYAWYDENSENKTHEVGTKQPNKFGFYDMHGNVSEWCEDWIGPYPDNAQTDPRGASSSSFRVFRGGGWIFTSGLWRSAARAGSSLSMRGNDLGFRLVRQ